MKILITGATGYLGSRLTRASLAAGHQVVICKRSFSDSSKLADLLSDIEAFDLDRTSLQSLFDESGPFDVVVHTATCYGRGGESSSQLVESNLTFPLQLFELAAQKSTPFINTDTGLDRSVSGYALSKKQFVDWGKFQAEKNGTRFLNLVVEHFYGPGDDPSKFVSWIVRSCLDNVAEIPLTAGDQQRDFIYIDDLVRAYLVLFNAINSDSAPFRQFEVGSGQVVSIRRLVESIHQMTGSKSSLNFGAFPYRENEAMHCCADIAPLETLGWTPVVDLESGLTLTVSGELKR